MRTTSGNCGARAACLLVLAALISPACGGGGGQAVRIGDGPAMPGHLDQGKLGAGSSDVSFLIERGRLLFETPFNTADGAGRPEITGTGAPRARREAPQNFNRISGPDANSCAGCHRLPRVGAGGDNVANVFVLGQRFGFVNFDQPPGEGDGLQSHTLESVADERNTVGMYGSGYVELLAREITSDLQAIRAEAIAAAALASADASRALVSKGISFGTILAHADGSTDAEGVQGIDGDLVLKPFHQKGAVVSIRQFTNNAMMHHHGMSASERVGDGVDDDGDGVVDELSRGDITATTVFQATLPVPGRVLPPEPASRQAVDDGEALFASIGCAACHVPALRLSDPVFREPSPLNPPGNLRPEDVLAPIAFDLTIVGESPHLSREGDASVLVPLYSDLKRHDMGSLLDDEQVVQAGIPTRMWITKKLWGFASEPPFLHNGRATTITEAILAHGGEGLAARNGFAALSVGDQARVVAFLKTLQILPKGTATLTIQGPAGEPLGDAPALRSHVSEAAAETGAESTDGLIEQGRRIFEASFNTLDGQGRPIATGTGAVRAARAFPQNFNRISGPDSNSCSGCHNLPSIGGGGDQVANVFVLGQRFGFVNFDQPAGEGDGFQSHTLDGVANERNTLGMFGAGFIELLAREMSMDLLAIRSASIESAAKTDHDVTSPLVSKGVSFGFVTAHPDGSVDVAGVQGIDADLVVRPFHQKGVVVSLREFSNNAVNHHHGMQSTERFGAGVDMDGDGKADELTVGDMTALVVFQATLPVPLPRRPESLPARSAARRGEATFSAIGCATCHVPTLRLVDPVFREPNPFNPAGNLRLDDVGNPVAVDLTTAGPGPHLARERDGSVLVPAFTDLKRHDMGAALDNERLVQAGVPTRMWLTKKLWGFASEPPFLHHGRATMITEAVLAHGGEGQAARDAFAGLPKGDRDDLVEFLKTLRDPE